MRGLLRSICFLCIIVGCAHAQERSVRIASFNVENFGASKMGKPEVVSELTSIIGAYDIVAVQEVANKPQRAMYAFLDVLNQTEGRSFGMLLSERSGRESDDISSQEQYVFFYDTETIRPAGQATLFADATSDLFQREPYAARFEVIGAPVSFVLITVHTDPDVALDEIGALDDVNEWAEDVFPIEQDFITLGDLNAGAAYCSVEELDGLDFRASPYAWLTPDDENTTLGQSQQAHDRIVVKGPIAELVTEVGVDEAFTDDAISDHWPIFLVVEVEESADGGGVSATTGGDASTAIRIARLLPNPEDTDRGREVVVLTTVSATPLALDGWRLVDSKGGELALAGEISGARELHILIPADSGLILRNAGDEISLFDGATLMHRVHYDSSREGRFEVFGE